MQALIGYRVKVTLNDSRSLIGQMLAFDAKFNLVLADCEEYRRVKHKKGSKANTAAASGGTGDDQDHDDDDDEEMKRMLGLVILRGETVVTLTVEGPPPVADDAKGPQVSWLTYLRAPPLLAIPSTVTDHSHLTFYQIGMGPGMGAPAGRGMGLAPPTM